MSILVSACCPRADINRDIFHSQKYTALDNKFYCHWTIITKALMSIIKKHSKMTYQIYKSFHKNKHT